MIIKLLGMPLNQRRAPHAPFNPKSSVKTCRKNLWKYAMLNMKDAKKRYSSSIPEKLIKQQKVLWLPGKKGRGVKGEVDVLMFDSMIQA